VYKEAENAIALFLMQVDFGTTHYRVD
jgi:hypothetical protein